MSTIENAPFIKEKTLLSEEFQSLKLLLEQTGFSPYLGYPGNPSEAIEAWLETVQESAAQNQTQLFYEKGPQGLAGAASFEPLPFDTELYGFPMAKIGFLEAPGDYEKAQQVQNVLLQKVFEICREKQIAHLSVRALPDQTALIHTLEKNGFYMVAGLLSLALEMKKFRYAGNKSSAVIRPFKPEDLEPLCEISRISFGNPKDWLDKAHADPNLPKEKSDELYVRWFRNCCNGSQAEQVLVAELDGKPAGYIALKLDGGGRLKCGYRSGSIPLNAVDPEYRKAGIYSALVQEGLKWFAGRVDWVTIKTQVTTLAVQRTWQKLGARPVLVEYAFHKYFGSK